MHNLSQLGSTQFPGIVTAETLSLSLSLFPFVWDTSRLPGYGEEMERMKKEKTMKRFTERDEEKLFVLVSNQSSGQTKVRQELINVRMNS